MTAVPINRNLLPSSIVAPATRSMANTMRMAASAMANRTGADSVRNG